MLFRITSCQNELRIVNFYDNITNHIYDEDNNKINFDSNDWLAHHNCQFDDGDKAKFYAKRRKLRKLKIQLGMKCNFHCKYCQQRKYDNEFIRDKCLPDMAIKFLHKISNAIESVEEILFIGGEPFVYIKILKLLISGLKGRFPNARFSTITNGSLINRDLAKWCIDNRLNLIISHDGYNFKKYRNERDIFDIPSVVEGIRYYYDQNILRRTGLKLSFNVVVSPENSNLTKIPCYFNEKIKREIPIQFESIVKVDELTASRISTFNDLSVNQLLSEMLRAGIDNSSDNRLRCLFDYGEKVVKRLVFCVNSNLLQYSCDNARKDVLSIDLNGNLLVCQSYPFVKTGYGRIEDIDHSTSNIPIRWSDRTNCKSCPYLISCLGGCPIQSEESHNLSCNNLRIWHAGLFVIAWYQLFHSVIMNIEPVN